MRLLLFIGMSCVLFSAKALTVEQLLNKVKEASSGSLSFNCEYTLFKDHAAQNVHSSYSGYCYQSDGQVYQKIKQTEFVYANGFFLKANREEKIMLLVDAGAASYPGYNPEKSLEGCKEKKMEDKGSYYLVSISYLPDPNIPLSGMTLKISKTYEVTESVLFYRTTQNFSKERGKVDYSAPRLRITFENINHQPKEANSFFDLSRYVNQKGKSLEPASAYPGFSVIDNRTKK